jgi:hypothetical protein
VVWRAGHFPLACRHLRCFLLRNRKLENPGPKCATVSGAPGGCSRGMSASQRAMVIDRARELYEKRAKERQTARKGNQPGAKPENLPALKADARDEAGQAANVSGKLVDHARTVREQGYWPQAPSPNNSRCNRSSTPLIRSSSGSCR